MCIRDRSIRAALEPADTNYYFYALGKDGVHHFLSLIHISNGEPSLKNPNEVHSVHGMKEKIIAYPLPK